MFNKQIILTVLLITLASARAEVYDIKNAMAEQMLQFLSERTSVFSEYNFTIFNTSNSVKFRYDDLDQALWYETNSTSVNPINKQLKRVEFSIDFGSVDLSGEFIAKVGDKSYKGAFQSIQVTNSSIYFEVIYNSRSRKSLVTVKMGFGRKYIHSSSWQDCELYELESHCYVAANNILEGIEKQVPAIFMSKVKHAIYNHGRPFQYKESSDVTDIPTTTPWNWDTTTDYYRTPDYDYSRTTADDYYYRTTEDDYYYRINVTRNYNWGTEPTHGYFSYNRGTDAYWTTKRPTYYETTYPRRTWRTI